MVSGVHGFAARYMTCVAESGHFECCLEYIDYSLEKKEWIRLFQKNPACSKQKSSESSSIMIRPSFPQWYWKDQVPEQFPNNDVIATVDETWKVGDLVDWLSEGCYWSGKITKLLDEDTVMVQLHKPPIGEGKCYRANRNDLRPTLDWSLIKGWTAPLSKVNGKGWYAARLIHQKSESEKSESNDETVSDDEDEDDGGGDGGCGGAGKDEQQSVSRGSNVSKEDPGSLIPEPSSTNSISSLQKDAILTSMKNLKPSSTSKLADPSHGAQAAVSTSQPGTASSIKQEHDSSLTEHEYLEKLDTVEGRLKYLVELTRSEQAHTVAALASHCRSSKDGASGK